MVKFVKGSHPYQLIRKIQTLNSSFQTQEKVKEHISENYINKLPKELGDIQRKTMLNPMGNSLLMQKKLFKIISTSCWNKRSIGPNEPERLTATWGKDTKYFYTAATIRKRQNDIWKIMDEHGVLSVKT